MWSKDGMTILSLSSGGFDKGYLFWRMRPVQKALPFEYYARNNVCVSNHTHNKKKHSEIGIANYNNENITDGVE